MPKMKTHTGSAKRFRLTKSGKVKFKRNGLRHILSSKSPKRKRSLRKDGFLAGGDAKSVKKLLPYAIF